MQYQYDDTFDREALERMLGLDVPVYVQYGRWLGDILLRGTFGVSMVGVIPIEERILARLPVTIELGVMAIVIGLVIALPVGIYSAIRQDTAADYTGRAAAIIGLATPNFWLALMVMIYHAYRDHNIQREHRRRSPGFGFSGLPRVRSASRDS